MNIKSRMMFHFLAQLLFTFMAILMILFWLIILAMYLISKDQLKANPKSGIIENLPYSMSIEENEEIELKNDWKENLKEEDMWLQIINGKGKVIYAYNTPHNFYQSYSINDLLLIEEMKQLDSYTVASYIETWEPAAYYYLFGYEEEQQQMLRSWYETYSDTGNIAAHKMMELEKQVKDQGGMLEIYQEGMLTEKIGEDFSTASSTLDIIGSVYLPGHYEFKSFVVNDETTKSAWIYQEINSSYQGTFLNVFSKREIEIMLIFTAIIFAIPILLSFWNGYRYGKPLVLFMDWLKIIEEKRYEDLLIGKEHARIFKKNGKVKFRYRLYKEVFISISEMSKRLGLAEQERKQLEKTREEWMAGISHDLRTPLSSIQGYGHLLESGQYDFTSVELQQMGQVIRDKSDYMVGLVDDFSLVFQLKNSAIMIQKEQVNLNEFIGSLVRRYEADVTLDDYSFVFEPVDNDCKVAIDPKWFVRVLDNLMSNAIKHNPEDTEIRLKIICEQDHKIIHISDNGRGMDETYVKHLFDRYYRGTSTSERTEGEGLGMSIAYAIVELHGGQIQVQSEIDKGTVVSIIL